MTSCNFKAPNGQNSILYTNLQTLVGDDKAAQVWSIVRSQEFAKKYLKGQTYMFLENTFRTDPEGFVHYMSKVLDIPVDKNAEPTASWMQKEFNLQPTQEVKYILKSVEILNSDKAAQVFKAADKGQWPIEKILKELQIPPAQRELILSFDTRNREEILTNLMANYSYTVEVNVAKGFITEYVNPNFEPNPEDGYAGAIEEHIDTSRNSQHYSNMTVPGGTNYTENEIRTPAITPSIKGHAAFATDQGIGWFRSDEQKIGGRYIPGVKEEYGSPETYGGIDTKTRRILEVQSDLFQKGREKKDLTNTRDKFVYTIVSKEEFDLATKNGTFEYLSNSTLDWYDENTGENKKTKINGYRYNGKLYVYKNGNIPATVEEGVDNKNQFLQLLNKDNNWVSFFVKAIIQDSARKGYEKILFPTGDTAAKVEGHQTLEAFIKEKQYRVNLLKEGMDYDQKLQVVEEKDNKGSYYRIYDPSNDSFKNGTHLSKETAQKNIDQRIEDRKREITQLENEIKQAEEGNLKLSSIGKFYEDTIKNILDKRGYNPERIKDEHGNEWYQVNLNEERDLTPLSFAAKKGKKKEEIPNTFETHINQDFFGVGNKKTDKIDYDEAVARVQNLYQLAINNPKSNFDLTIFQAENFRKGIYGGYTPVEVAALFASQPIPNNVSFDPKFESLIVNSSPYQQRYDEAREVPFFSYDEVALLEDAGDRFVPIRDEQGNKTGQNFTSAQQVATIESIVGRVWNYFKKDASIKVGEMLRRGGTVFVDFEAFAEKYEKGLGLPSYLAQEKATIQAQNIRTVLNSWEDFIGRVIYRLETRGILVKGANANEIIKSILENRDDLYADGAGRGLLSWEDSSFEQDPRDTASTRIKWFLSSIRDVEIGEEVEPVNIPFRVDDPAVRNRILGRDPIKGTKTISIRTPKQVDKSGAQVGRQYVTSINGYKLRLTFERELTEKDLTDPTIIANAAEEGVIPKLGDVLVQIAPWKPNKDVVQDKKNFLGFSQLVDGNVLMQKILEITSGLPNTLDIYLDALIAEGKQFRPVLIEVANQVRKLPQQLQREFVKVMSKQYSEFNITLHSKRRDGFLDITPINANSGSAVQGILKQWQENQKHANIVKEDELGNLVINQQLATNFYNELIQIYQGYKTPETIPDAVAILRPFAKRLFEANGIVMPDEALEYLFNNMSKVTKNTSLSGNLQDQFGFTDEGIPTGMFSVIVMRLNGLSEEAPESEQTSYLTNNNPLYSESTTMKLLARLAYRFSKKTAAGSHPNSEGKTIYSFTMNSFLSLSARKLKNDGNYRSLLSSTLLGKHNWLLNKLISDTEQRDNFGLQYVDGLKESYKRGASGVVRPEMSTREQLVYALGNFQRQGNKNVNFLSLTHADKPVTPLFTGIEKFVLPTEGLGKEAEDAIYQTALGEFERIRMWYKENQKGGTANDSFNKAGGYFYFIPQLNYDFMAELVQKGDITQQDLNTIWAVKGVPNMNTGVVALKEIVLDIFENDWLQPEVERLDARLEKEGFYTQGLVDYAYLSKNVTNITGMNSVEVRRGERNFFNEAGEQIQTADVTKAFYQQFGIKDFLVNYFLVHTSLSSLLYGDPALTWKGKSPIDYQAVAESLIEYTKRLAGDVAPGQDPTWDNGPKETYKTLTLLDDERIHKYMESLPAYKDKAINGTDAEEVTTVAEQLYVLKSAGLLANNIYKEMTDIINKAQSKPGRYYEFTNSAHKEIVMQIMKPVYFSQDFDSVPGEVVIHYVKSSSMALYPPMTKYYQIDDLRQHMEKNGVARANFISAKKMGAPAGKGAKIFDEEGNLSIPKNIDSFQQTLTREGFRIQQEVPYDEEHDSILTGSQSNKIFTEGISDLMFDFPGYTNPISGKILKDLKEETRKDMIRLQHENFVNRIGAEVIGDKLVIRDKKKLLSLLEDEAVTRGYPSNDLDLIRRTVQTPQADGSVTTELAIPLFFNQSSNRFESLLLSLIKNIGKVYFPGKSFIQATSAGFRFKEKLDFEDLDSKNKEGIVWMPGYKGEELKTMTPDSPAEVLIPFNFFITNSEGNQVRVDVKDYASKDDQGKLVIDTTKIPQELLQHIVFRIPTQKHNSMLPVKVVGFIPAIMGDTIIVPAAITAQMGSDFDVDKLFSYRRPYKYDKNTKTFTVDDDSDQMTTLINRYFNIYWAVLTHPQMYRTVMEPLDRPDLKNEAARAAANLTPHNYFSILTQIDDFVSQKDATIMRGISSLFVTFSALSEDKGLYAGKLVEDNGYEEEFPVQDSETQLQAKVTYQPSGIKFKIEGTNETKHAYDLSKPGEATYYKDDVEEKDGEKVFVDPTTGKTRPFDSSEALKRSRIDSQVTFQSAFLDHTKERIIDKINVNLQTVYAAFAATALASTDGHRVSEKHIALLLQQPIVLEYVDQLNRSRDSFSTEFNANAAQEIYDTLLDKYALGAEHYIVIGASNPEFEQAIKDKGYDVLSIPDLKKNLVNSEDKDYLLHQASMLIIFKRLDEIGRMMGSLQRTLNQDPAGPGKDMTIVLQRINERGELKFNGVIANSDKLLQSEQGFIHTVELDTAREAYRGVLPYEGLQNVLSLIIESTGRKSLSSTTTKDIVEDFKSFVFSDTALGLSDNPRADRIRLLYGTKDEKSLAARVWNLQQTSQNYFLNQLSLQQGDNVNTPSYVFYLASRASALGDQESTAAFLEGLTSKDEKERRVYEDLIRYAYLTGGVNGSFSITKAIPPEALTNLPFASKLREINDSLSNPGAVTGFDYDFVEQWIQHTPAMMRKIPEGYNQHVGEKFTLPVPANAVSDLTLRPLLSAKGAYPMYLSHWDKNEVRWLLFKKKADTSNVYVRIDTLGNSYTSEYAKDAGYQKSIFLENRALIEPDEANRFIQLDDQVFDDELWNTPDTPWSSFATQKLGITKAKYTVKETEDLIQSWTTNQDVPAHMQIVLKAVREILAQSPNKISLSITAPNPDTTTAARMTEKGEMLIENTNYSTPEFTGVLLHELIHGLTLPFTRRSTTEQKKFKALYDSVEELKLVMAEARTSIIKEAATKGFNEEALTKLLEKTQKGQSHPTAAEVYWGEMMYAVSNVDEFMSHIAESKDLQLFLNGQKSQYAGTTLFDRIIDWFSKFLTELAKALGVNIDNESILAVALKKTFNVIEEVRAVGNTMKRPDSTLRQIANTYFNGIYSQSGEYVISNQFQAQQIIKDMKKEFPILQPTIEKTENGEYKITVPKTIAYGFARVKQQEAEKEITDPITRVYGKVQEQMQEISSSIAKNKKDADVLRQRALLRDLRALANDLKATSDLNKIADLAEYQLDWSQRIKRQYLAGDKPVTINQVMTATRLLGVWSNLLDLVYNGVSGTDVVYDQVFVDLQAEAQNLQLDFHNKILPAVFTKLSQEPITTKDFMHIEDMHPGVSRFLSIERAKDKVTQEVALTIQNTHRAYLETGHDVVKRISEFEKDMKKIASSKGQKIQDFYENFFQDGPNWGLVTQYSPEFYRWKSGLKKKLSSTIEDIEKTATDKTEKAILIRSAYKKYWRSLDQRAGFVDVRKLFTDDGVDLTDEPSAKYIKGMEDEYGKEFANDIIQKAKTKYQKYLQEVEDINTVFDAQVESGMMSEAEAEEALAAWDLENSPLIKLDSRDNAPSSGAISEKYLELVPHKSAKGFSGQTLFDTKYAKVQQDPELMRAYNKIQALMDEFTQNLPFFLEGKFGDNFLPAIKNRLISDVSGAINYVKGAPKRLIDNLTANSYEEFMQNRTSREIPILYLENPFEDIQAPQKGATEEQRKDYEKKRKERAKEYSRNIPRVLELFGLMSYHYKYFSEAKDAIDLGTEILKKADKDMQSNTRMVEKNGKITSVTASLSNTLAALEYTKDVLMFKRNRELEGKTGEHVQKLDKTMKDSLTDLRTEQEALDAKYANNEINAIEHTEGTKAIDEKLKKFKTRKFYASKIGDNLITWSQLKSLSYNPFSAINNFSFGLISASIHANGGQDFGWKEFVKAFGIMMNATGRSLGLNRLTGKQGGMTKVAEKILNIMDRMGVMGELTDSEYGKSNIKKPTTGLRSLGAPYQMLRTGDYFVKATTMVAILNRETITIDGKETSLWKAIGQDGHLSIEDKAWESDDPREQEKWNKVRNKVIAVVKVIMGNQDKSSPMLAKKNILWRLVGQFRLSWIAEGIASRFEGSQPDIQLGRERKGRYRTYGDLGFLQSISVLAKQALSVLPFLKINPYNGVKLKNGKEFSATDKGNMRRNMAEISWFLLLYGAAMLLGSMASGGDDEAKKAKHRFLANMAIRNYQDVGLYGSPSILDSILGNVMPASSTITDTMKFFNATGRLLMDDDYTSEQWFLKLTKAGFIPWTTLINRYKTMTEKNLSTINR